MYDLCKTLSKVMYILCKLHEIKKLKYIYIKDDEIKGKVRPNKFNTI
jgi:hypothetical protein